jgi:hypothetical protein
MEGLDAGMAPEDSDTDGIPDYWEREHKLNPENSEDANSIVLSEASPEDRHKGYTYIEYYINEIADKVIRQ